MMYTTWCVVAVSWGEEYICVTSACSGLWWCIWPNLTKYSSAIYHHIELPRRLQITGWYNLLAKCKLIVSIIYTSLKKGLGALFGIHGWSTQTSVSIKFIRRGLSDMSQYLVTWVWWTTCLGVLCGSHRSSYSTLDVGYVTNLHIFHLNYQCILHSSKHYYSALLSRYACRFPNCRIDTISFHLYKTVVWASSLYGLKQLHSRFSNGALRLVEGWIAS